MTRGRSRLAMPLALAALLSGAPAARSENFLDFGVGAGFVVSDTVALDDEGGLFSSDESARDSVSFDTSLSFRFRAGRYFDATPWFGTAASISYFEAEGGPIRKNRIVPITGLVLFRLPLLKDGTFTGGRVFPYIGFGPSIVISDVEVNAFGDVEDGVNSASVDLGVEIHAGVAFHVNERLRVFAEYGLTYFRQEVSDKEFELDLFDLDGDTTATTDILGSQIIVGFTWTF